MNHLYAEMAGSATPVAGQRVKPSNPTIPRPPSIAETSPWNSIATQPFGEAHFATMAPELDELCIKAGSPYQGTVLDPFGGAGTTGLATDRLQRDAILIELNPAYADMARRRIASDSPLFAEVA